MYAGGKPFSECVQHFSMDSVPVPFYFYAHLATAPAYEVSLEQLGAANRLVK